MAVALKGDRLAGIPMLVLRLVIVTATLGLALIAGMRLRCRVAVNQMLSLRHT